MTSCLSVLFWRNRLNSTKGPPENSPILKVSDLAQLPPHPNQAAKRKVKTESPPPEKQDNNKHNSPPFYSLTNNTEFTIPVTPIKPQDTSRRSISSQLVSVKHDLSDLLEGVLARFRTNSLRNQARRRFEVAPKEDLEEDIKLLQQDQKLAIEILEKKKCREEYLEPI